MSDVMSETARDIAAKPGIGAGGRTAAVTLVVLAALVLIMFVLSLSVGYAPLPVADLWHAVWAKEPTLAGIVLFDIRLPRALLAVMVGASLGMAGAVMQGLLRNPLAEPGIIGVSSSAALGAVIVFYSGLAGQFPLGLPLGGMAGGLLATLVLYGLAGISASTLTLILAGVAINSITGALTALALNLSPNPYSAMEIMFWLMGSLADRSFDHVGLIVLPCLVGWVLLATTGRGLDALTLGEDVAQSLGFNLPRLRLQIILGTALCVGSAVAVTGAVSFVGLVVPHLLRRCFDHQPGRLLLPSALGGAVLVLVADMIARQSLGGQELKLGVVTAMIGAPFFLMLVLRLRRELT